MFDDKKQLWIGALRGGTYSQTREAFYREAPGPDPDGTGRFPAGHCCLAVLTDVAWRNDLRTIRAVDDSGNTITPDSGKQVEYYQELKVWGEDDDEWVPVDPTNGGAEEALGYTAWTYDYDPYSEPGAPWHKWENCEDELPVSVSLWAGLAGETNPTLAPSGDPMVADTKAIAANDSKDWTFEQIADAVEEHL